MTYKEKLQKELQEHKDTINSDFREQYADGLDIDHKDKSIDIAEEVYNCDFESMDFNLGFEQGMMRGLEIAIRLTE